MEAIVILDADIFLEGKVFKMGGRWKRERVCKYFGFSMATRLLIPLSSYFIFGQMEVQFFNTSSSSKPESY
jgi:hypothetical protein